MTDAELIDAELIDTESVSAESADPEPADPDGMGFWSERRLCTLATVRKDGTPHLVPVGVTYDPETGIARIITNSTSAKARRIAASGPVPAAVSQVDGRRWTTLEGMARVNQDPEAIADAVRRYAKRYRQPAVNPLRVVIEIEVSRVLGSVKVPLPDGKAKD